MSTFKPDAGIPLLTEVIEVTAHDSQERLVAPEAQAATSVLQAHSPGTEDWHQFELELRERVLHQVMTRIDDVLEQRVRDTLADVLQTAVSDLAQEIRNGLRRTLKDTITSAIKQEISAARASKK